MSLLLSLADKRQKDLMDSRRKERVLSALFRLKLSLPPFSDVMKKYVRDPNNVATQVSLYDFSRSSESVMCFDRISATSKRIRCRLPFTTSSVL